MYSTATGCSHCDTLATAFREPRKDAESISFSVLLLPPPTTTTTSFSSSSLSSSSTPSLVPSSSSLSSSAATTDATTLNTPSVSTVKHTPSSNHPSSSSDDAVEWRTLYTNLTNDYHGSNGNHSSSNNHYSSSSSFWDSKISNGYSLHTPLSHHPTLPSANIRNPLPVPIARIPVSPSPGQGKDNHSSWSYSPSLLLAAAAACTPTPIDLSFSLSQSSSRFLPSSRNPDDQYIAASSYLYSGTRNRIPPCRDDDHASLASIETWSGTTVPHSTDLAYKIKCYDQALFERVHSKSILSGWLNILSPTMDPNTNSSTMTISKNTSATPYDGATGKWVWLPRYAILTRAALWLFTATDNQLLSITSNSANSYSNNASSTTTSSHHLPPSLIDPYADRPSFRTAQRAFLHGDSYVNGINGTDFQFYTEHQMLMFRSSSEQETAAWILYIQSGITLRRPILSSNLLYGTPILNSSTVIPSKTVVPVVNGTATKESSVGTDTTTNSSPSSTEVNSSSSILPPSLLLMSDNDILGYADHYESTIIEHLHATVIDDPIRKLFHTSPSHHHDSNGHSKTVTSEDTKTRTNSSSVAEPLIASGTTHTTAAQRRKSSVAPRTAKLTFANDYSNNPLARSLTHRILQSFSTRLRLRAFVRRLMPEHTTLIRAWEHIQVYVETHPTATTVPCTCGISNHPNSSLSYIPTDTEIHTNYQRAKMQALTIAGRFLFSQDAIPLPSATARELFALLAKYGITVEALAIANSLLSEKYYNPTLYDTNSTDEENYSVRSSPRSKSAVHSPVLPPQDLFATAQSTLEELIYTRILIPYSRTQLSRVTTARKMVHAASGTTVPKGSKNSGNILSLGSFTLGNQLKRLSISIDNASMNNKTNYNNPKMSSAGTNGRRSSLFALPGTSLLSPSSVAAPIPTQTPERRTTRAGSIFSSPGRKHTIWSGFLSPSNDNDFINSNIFNENDPLNRIDNGDDLDNVGINSNTMEIFTPAIIEPNHIPLHSVYALCDVEMINQPLMNIIGQNEVYFLTNLLPTFIIANRAWKYAWSRVLGSHIVKLPEFGIGTQGGKEKATHGSEDTVPVRSLTVESTHPSSSHPPHHHHHESTVYHTCGHYRIPSAILEWTGKKHGLSINQLKNLLTVTTKNRIDDILDDLDLPSIPSNDQPIVSRRSFSSPSNLLKGTGGTASTNPSPGVHHHHSKSKQHEYGWYKAWLDTNEHTLPAVKRALQDTVIDAILLSMELCDPVTQTVAASSMPQDTTAKDGAPSHHPSSRSHIHRTNDTGISSRSLQNMRKYGKMYESLIYGTTMMMTENNDNPYLSKIHPSSSFTMVALPKPLDIRPFIIRPGHPLLSVLTDTILPHSSNHHAHHRVPSLGKENSSNTVLSQLNGIYMYPYKAHGRTKVISPSLDPSSFRVCSNFTWKEFYQQFGIHHPSFTNRSVTVVTTQPSLVANTNDITNVLPLDRKERISRITTNNTNTVTVPLPRIVSELSSFMKITNAKGSIFSSVSSSVSPTKSIPSPSIYLSGYPVPVLCRIPCWIGLSDIVRNWPTDHEQSQVWKLSENTATIDISLIGNAPSILSSLSFQTNYRFGLERLQHLLSISSNQRKFICGQIHIHADGTVIVWENGKYTESLTVINPQYDPSVAGIQLFQPFDSSSSSSLTIPGLSSSSDHGTFLGALNLADTLDISYTRTITLPKYAIDLIVTGLGILTLIPCHPQLHSYLYTKLQEGYLCRTVTNHALAHPIYPFLPVPKAIEGIIGTNLQRKLKLQIRVTKISNNNTNDTLDNGRDGNSLTLVTNDTSSSSSGLPRIMVLGTTLWKRGKFRTAYQPRQVRIHVQLPLLPSPPIAASVGNTTNNSNNNETNGNTSVTSSKGGSIASTTNTSSSNIGTKKGSHASGTITVAPTENTIDTLIDTLHLPLTKSVTNNMKTSSISMNVTTNILSSIGSNNNLPILCYNLALRCYSTMVTGNRSDSSNEALPYTLSQLGQMNDTEIKLDYTKNGNVRGSILLWSKGQPRVLAVLQEVGAGVAGGGGNTSNSNTTAVEWTKGDGKSSVSSLSNFRKLLLAFSKAKATDNAPSASSSTAFSSNRERSLSRDRSNSLSLDRSVATTNVWAPTYRFALIMPDRTWHLAADSPDMARKWIALLSLFTVSRETTLNKTLASSSYSNNDLPLVSPNNGTGNNNNSIISRKPFNINVMDDAYRIHTTMNGGGNHPEDE